MVGKPGERNKGMRNDYMPDPESEWGQRSTLCDCLPLVSPTIYGSRTTGVFYSDDSAATWKSQPARTGRSFRFPIAADAGDGRCVGLCRREPTWSAWPLVVVCLLRERPMG